MKDRRLYSNENGYVDDALITNRSKEEIDIVCRWIDMNLFPRITVLDSHASYGLKHILERETGICLTNNEIKDEMQMWGYTPANSNDLNWYYCISKRSPAFNKK